MELRETIKGNNVNAHQSKQVSRREQHHAFGKKLAARAVAIAIVFSGAYLVFRLLRHFGVFNPVFIEQMVANAGPWGPLAIIGIITATSFSVTVPSSPFIVLAGALYGPIEATVYAFIGILIGSSLAFWIARIFREPIIRLIGEHAEILTKFQQKYVMIVLFVTRVFPVISFEVMSYAAGLTSISYTNYVLATLGAVAGVFLFATLGDMGASIAFSAPSEFASIGLALTVVAMLFVIPIAIDHYNPFGWKEKILQK